MTAVVARVVLNLAIWHTLHVILVDHNVIDWFALTITTGASILLIRSKVGVTQLIFAAALLGIIYKEFMPM